ncbi:hypothetical protein DFQ26_008916 [Actinomortierella ambigua]|nr:hypothetical protein DFQ26_008916 [Actinomortierella ambigua]
MVTSIHSVLFIPLILDAIGKQLSVSGLERCRAVSRDWRVVFTPYYWRGKSLQVDARKINWSVESQALLKKYGPHIRQLVIINTSVLPIIAPHCQNVSHLEVQDAVGDNKRLPGRGPDWQRCVEFMKSSCPRLKSLTVHNWWGSQFHELVSKLTQTGSASQSLQFLKIDCMQKTQLSTRDLLDLLIGLPQLTTLGGQWRGVWRVDHDEAQLERCTFRLRSMPITHNPTVLTPFWKQCPFLESHRISWCHRSDFDMFAAIFDTRDARQQPIRHVRAISLPILYPTPDRLLAGILRGCVRHYLTSLSTSSSPIGPEAFVVLLETQSQSLEILELSQQVEPGMCASPWIQKLLTSCPRLRELRVLLYTEVDITNGIHLLAHDILNGPWVCSGLTTLLLPILVAPTTSHIAQGTDSDKSTMVNHVMQQIGQMTKLETLGTSHYTDILEYELGLSREEVIVPDLLPFSLGSDDGGGGGLQYLAGLKQLRELRLYRCEPKIGIAEVAWMKEHWPSLRTISGIACQKQITSALSLSRNQSLSDWVSSILACNA